MRAAAEALESEAKEEEFYLKALILKVGLCGWWFMPQITSVSVPH